MNIIFNFSSRISLESRKDLKNFISFIFKTEHKKCESLSIVFCSDDFLLDINKTYLHHNYFTDIITFNLSAPNSKFIDGEIYISVDTIRDNSIRFQSSIKIELHRVIFHGVLHLCNYNDNSRLEKLRMTSKEDYYLDLYFKGSTWKQ